MCDPEAIPKHSINYRHIPEATETFQKLPIHIPEATETFQKLPTHSRSYRNIPETTDTLQELPKHSSNYRNIPETIDTFQKPQKRSRNYRSTPEATEAFPRSSRNIQESTKTLQKRETFDPPTPMTFSYPSLYGPGTLPPQSAFPAWASTAMPSLLYGIPSSYRCPVVSNT